MKKKVISLSHLGHASLLFTTERTSILFDPVLNQFHHEGLYMIWPERLADFQELPEIEIIVISHRHPDHFDLDSLIRFPRNIPIVVPDDQVIISALAELGFKHLIVAQSLRPIEIQDTTLTPTPAAMDAIENGYVIESNGIKIWNLIDTVPRSSDISLVNSFLGPFDLAIVPWQPLIDVSFSQGKEFEFPIGQYKRLVENALQIDSRYLALGACGFCAAPEFSYLNDSIFPISRSRFISDLSFTSRPGSLSILQPVAGDLIEVSEQVELRSQVLSYCRSIGQGTNYQWKPWASHLHRRSSLSFSEISKENADIIEHFFLDKLLQFIIDNNVEFHFHRTRRCVYEYNVYYRNSHETWFLDFSFEEVIVQKKVPSRWPTAIISITAEALYSLLQFSNTWSRIVQSSDYIAIHLGYRIIEGEVVAVAETEDPLKLYFAGDDHLARVLQSMIFNSMEQS